MSEGLVAGTAKVRIGIGGFETHAAATRFEGKSDRLTRTSISMIQNGPRRSRVALHKDRVQGFECFWLREPLTQHRGKTAVPYFVGPKYRVLTRRQLPDACSVQRRPYPGYRQCPSMDRVPKTRRNRIMGMVRGTNHHTASRV
jgi:hypothetical protein